VENADITKALRAPALDGSVDENSIAVDFSWSTLLQLSDLTLHSGYDSDPF
jgi:hypothetical protein